MINTILKKQLEKISLSNQEVTNLKKIASNFINQISKQKIKAIVGGSLAKNTLIKKQVQDIDIFIVFENEQETTKLEEILKKAGLNAKKVHGSRDYFQIFKENIILEIIPVVKAKDLKKVNNVTDFSLLHVNYIKNKIKKNKKLSNEIKLAKSFCFSQDCYGAESYISGFSGYALEVLICYYGSFIKFLKEITKASKINQKIIIDPEKKFKSKTQVLQELNESKLTSPIILIDPVYKYRNIAAGLSQETFERFCQISSKFLKKPNLQFFEKKEINKLELEKRAKSKKAKFLEINLKTDKQEGDIAATKMKKFSKFIISKLKEKQQKVIENYFVYKQEQDAKAYLIVKENKEIEIKGPQKENKEAVANFKRVRKKIYFKKSIAYAKEKINLQEIFESLRNFQDEMSVSFELI